MKLGYRGQGITVASIEDLDRKHGKQVANILKQILPEANILTGIKYYKEVPDGIDGYTCSQDISFSDKPNRVEKAKELYSKGVLMTCAVGNDSYDSFSHLSKYNEWISIGACHYKDGKPQRAVYSSVTDYIDFTSLTYLDTSHGKFNGSSCATPVFQAMAMLVQCYFLNKINRKLTLEELLTFIKDNCIDLDKEGLDPKTGYGLFVLPNPDNIDVTKYAGENMKKIVLKIDSNIAVVDGEEKTLDTAPTIINNRTLVPLRFIAEELGCNVSWNDKTREVTIEQ